MKLNKIKLAIIACILSIISCNNNNSTKDDLAKKNGEINKAKTAEEALAELKYGNNRFLDNALKNTNYKEEIEATKGGQHPYAFILTCIDSRVPPEIIFDQGIGNVFVGRLAGNIEDDDILGSMEFAAKVKHTKLFVVLGHSHCGAVKGAIDNAGLEHLTQLTNKIKPAINPQKTYPLEDEVEDIVSRKNVSLTIEQIIKNSATLRLMVEEKEIKIIGAFYDISNGEVEFFDEKNREK
jgi:carbonic anhydrase